MSSQEIYAEIQIPILVLPIDVSPITKGSSKTFYEHRKRNALYLPSSWLVS